MREEGYEPDEPTLDLSAQALLYANGELAEGEAVAFEERLEVDQAARDALCQAVELSAALTGEQPAAPDPAYRQRVRLRLRQRRRISRLRTSSPGLLIYLALWLALGAVAAVILMVFLAHMAETPPPTTKPATSTPAG